MATGHARRGIEVAVLTGMRISLSIFILTCLQLIMSSTSWASCWTGYTEDLAQTNMVVYAQSNSDGRSYAVGKISARQKVCVSNQNDDGYVQVRYEDPSRPGFSKVGYVSVSKLKGVRTEAVTPFCATCQTKQTIDDYYIPVENGSEDIRSTSEKKQWSSTSSLGTPLPYANRIMENVKYGLALGRTGSVSDKKCARAVSRILRGADLLPGAIGGIKTPGGFNGEDGYKYLSRVGFYDDKSACNRPGVVLIYGQSRSGYGKRPGQRGFLQGDLYGHAEILGTDGSYYYYHADDAPINNILGNNRRPLLHCMVSRVGMNGGSL